MKNGLGDLWMPIICLAGLLASLGFGLHKVSACLDCWLLAVMAFDLLDVNECWGIAACQGLQASFGFTLHNVCLS